MLRKRWASRVFHQFKKNQNGLSILEFVVAIGISGIVVLTMSQAMVNFLKSQNRIDKEGNREDVKRQILEALDCGQTMAPYCPGGTCAPVGNVPTCPAATGPAPSVSKVNVRRANGALLVAANGQRIGDWVVRAECKAGLGIELRIAGIQNGKAVDTATAGDFLKDPLTKLPFNWLHPNATLLPPSATAADTISCKSSFQPLVVAAWCNAPFVVANGGLCPNNGFQVGYNSSADQVCCNTLGTPATVAAENFQYLTRFASNASDQLQSSVINQSNGNLGIGSLPDASNLYFLTLNSSGGVGGLYLSGVNVDSTASLMVEGNRPGNNPADNAASVDFRNVGNNDWWHMSLRGNGTLGFHHRNSYAQPAADGIVTFNLNGTIVGSGAGIGACSDRRLKSEIRKLGGNTLDRLHLVEGVSFQYKSDTSGKLQFGVIAQNVQPQFPELVGVGGDGYKTVNYDGFIPILIEAVKTIDKNTEGVPKIETHLADLEREFQEQEEVMKEIQKELELR